MMKNKGKRILLLNQRFPDEKISVVRNKERFKR